jgi:hypothetical protein
VPVWFRMVPAADIATLPYVYAVVPPHVLQRFPYPPGILLHPLAYGQKVCRQMPMEIKWPSLHGLTPGDTRGAGAGMEDAARTGAGGGGDAGMGLARGGTGAAGGLPLPGPGA